MIADKPEQAFVQICFRMVQESKKKWKILYQSLKTKDQIINLLPATPYDKMTDYVRQYTGKNTVITEDFVKDPWLFAQAKIEAIDALAYFSEMNSTLSI